MNLYFEREKKKNGPLLNRFTKKSEDIGFPLKKNGLSASGSMLHVNYAHDRPRNRTILIGIMRKGLSAVPSGTSFWETAKLLWELGLFRLQRGKIAPRGILTFRNHLSSSSHCLGNTTTSVVVCTIQVYYTIRNNTMPQRATLNSTYACYIDLAK